MRIIISQNLYPTNFIPIEMTALKIKSRSYSPKLTHDFFLKK